MLERLLPEKEGFPGHVEVVAYKTLSKRAGWWKAVALVRTSYGGKERQQLRLYAWRWSDKDKSWKQRQKFNFSGKSYLPFVINTLEAYGGKVSETSAAGAVAFLTSRIADLERQAEEARLASSRSRLPDMETKVRQFERMLASRRFKERDLQRFLRHEFWMFGAEYRRARAERQAGIKGRNDFLLERDVGYHDVVELKLPSDPLFVGGPKLRMSGELKNAVSQMVSYLHYYYKHYLSDKDQTRMDVLYPKGLIVIGRRVDSERETLAAHNAVLHRIEIVTYDDVLDRAKQALKSIKRSGRSSIAPSA